MRAIAFALIGILTGAHDGLGAERSAARSRQWFRAHHDHGMGHSHPLRILWSLK